MKQCSIRQAVRSDTPKLHGLDRVAQHDEKRTLMIDRAIREERCWVIEQSNVVMGYGIISHEFFGRSFLDLVYIDEQKRGSGIGPKLIRALEQQSKSGSLFTSTNQSNKHMQYVLEGLGYEPSGIIHNLDPGDPEIVYVKHGVRT